MSKKRKGGLAVLIGALGLVGVFAVMWLTGTYAPRLDRLVQGLGPWAPVAYVAACALAGVLMVPGSATKLAAGAIFGLAEGMLWGFLGAFCGALAAFGVARLGRRSWLEKRIRSLPRLSHFDRSVSQHGRRITLLTRLSPLVPFNVLNYALGFSQVRARDYTVSSLGMLPSVWLYVYSGQIARDVALNAGGSESKPWWEWALLGVGLVATIAATHILGKKAKAAVEHEAPELAALVAAPELVSAIGGDPREEIALEPGGATLDEDAEPPRDRG